MNKILIAIIALVLLVLLSVYFFYSGEKETPPIKPPSKKGFCSEIKLEALNRICLIAASKNVEYCYSEKEYDKICYELVIEAMDVSENVCKNIRNNYGKFLCYKKLAFETGNIDFCMGNQECFKELALVSGNTEFCDEIYNPNEKSKCFALVLNDRGYCDEVEDEFEKKTCLASVPEDIGDCISSGYYDIDCIIKLAVETRNSALCDSFTRENEAFKWRCLVAVDDDIQVCDDADASFVNMCKIYYLKDHIELLE